MGEKTEDLPASSSCKLQLPALADKSTCLDEITHLGRGAKRSYFKGKLPVPFEIQTVPPNSPVWEQASVCYQDTPKTTLYYG